jgi:hypothetical protein
MNTIKKVILTIIAVVGMVPLQIQQLHGSYDIPVKEDYNVSRELAGPAFRNDPEPTREVPQYGRLNIKRYLPKSWFQSKPSVKAAEKAQEEKESYYTWASRHAGELYNSPRAYYAKHKKNIHRAAAGLGVAGVGAYALYRNRDRLQQYVQPSVDEGKNYLKRKYADMLENEELPELWKAIEEEKMSHGQSKKFWDLVNLKEETMARIDAARGIR